MNLCIIVIGFLGSMMSNCYAIYRCMLKNKFTNSSTSLSFSLSVCLQSICSLNLASVLQSIYGSKQCTLVCHVCLTCWSIICCRKELSKSLQNRSSGFEKNVDANSSQRTENTSHKEVSESKQLFSDSTQNSEVGLVNNSSQKINNTCDKEVTINRGKSDRSYCISKSTGKKVIENRESDRISGFSDSCGNNESLKQKDDNGCQKIGLFDSSSGPHIMDVDDTCVAHLDKVEKRESTRMPVKACHNQKQKTYSTESDINALTGNSRVKVKRPLLLLSYDIVVGFFSSYSNSIMIKIPLFVAIHNCEVHKSKEDFRCAK